MNREDLAATVRRTLSAVRRVVLPGFVLRVVEQLVRVSVLDLAARLAAQVFLTALPLLFVIAAYFPEEAREQLRGSLRDVLGADSAAMGQVEHVYAGGEYAGESWGLASAALVLVSATALSRTLQRLCERAWRLPHTGVRVMAWRWVVWLLVWSAALVCQGVLRDGFGAGPALGVPLLGAAAVALWWWTPYLMLAGRTGWLPLLPGALLTAAGATAFAATSGLWMPRSLRQSVDQFGPLGTVFTLLSWLICFCATVVVGIAVGRVLAQEELVRRWLRIPEVPAGGSAEAGEGEEAANAGEEAAEAGEEAAGAGEQTEGTGRRL